MSETAQLIHDAAHRLFAQHVTPELLLRAIGSAKFGNAPPCMEITKGRPSFSNNHETASPHKKARPLYSPTMATS